ncbi:MAG: DUF4340 domain-containing protein [Pirellulales bacterium]
MTENTRTASYIGVALVLLIVAALVNRKPAVETDETLAGKILFPALKSPDDVGGLEIVTSADGVSQTEFNVKRDAAGWSLPSHEGYPADAEKQVASATSSLVDLKALSVVSTSVSEHAEYGVVDPEKASPGAQGIGKLIKVLDKSGNNLARLVVGKKDTEGGGDLEGRELWFVRAQLHDVVYRVALPTAKFSTSFADWIETDLLKLDAWDISQVTLKDYTFDIAPGPLGERRVAYDQLSTIELAFSDKDSKWSLKNLIQFENDQPKPVELGTGEELNSTRLNEMKTALDDLKIVDVRAKPAGLSANLKANKSIFDDKQAIQSLSESGFYAVAGEEGEPEILSSDGEVLVRMKDGIEYTLRFGGVAGVGGEAIDEAAASETKGKDKPAGTTKEEEEQGATLNRFIMVSARFNKDLVPKPELEPLPGETDEEKTEDPSKTKAEAAETKTPESQSETKAPAGESKDQRQGAAKSSDDSPPSKEDDKSAVAEGQEELHFVKLQAGPTDAGKAKAKADTKSSKSPSGKSPDATKKLATKQDEKSKSAKSTDDATAKDGPVKTDGAETSVADKPDGTAKQNGEAKKSAEAKSDVDDAKAGEKPSPEAQEDLALRRKRIETENERKQKEYDEKVNKGEARAQELNARFAEWYYVVSEATYRKIHLNRDDVIQKKVEEKNNDANGADSGAADPLGIPPLTIDPFQKRNDAKNDQ